LSASSAGMTFAASLLRPSSVLRRALPLQLASETYALRQPRTFNFCGTLMVNPKTTVAAPAAAELAGVDSECTPMPIESQMTRGAWTREIDELCRALEAQRRTHFPSTEEEKSNTG